MKIVIIGLGTIGKTILKNLSGEEHTITFIDEDKNRIPGGIPYDHSRLYDSGLRCLAYIGQDGVGHGYVYRRNGRFNSRQNQSVENRNGDERCLHQCPQAHQSTLCAKG